MNKDYTHLTIVLDRSGSMGGIASDMEGGLNALIEEQKKLTGKCTVSFYKFDSITERDLFFADIKSVGTLKLEPRGSTALNDCLAQAILETGSELRKLPENNRPSLVSFVVVTDGEENSSREYKDFSKVKAMIDEQQVKYNWMFNYLGANQDSIAVSAKYGIQNVTNYTGNNSDKVFRNYSGKIASSRNLVASGLEANLSYNANDVAELTNA